MMLPELEVLQVLSEKSAVLKKQQKQNEENEAIEKEKKLALVLYQELLPGEMLRAAKEEKYEAIINCGNTKYSKYAAEELERLVKLENKHWNTCVYNKIEETDERVDSVAGIGLAHKYKKIEVWYFRIYWHWRGYQQV